jgi:hypothetical protein
MEQWLVTVLTVIGSVGASSGFWAWMMKRDNTKTAMARLLRGLAYDKIVTLGLNHIERGWISRDEYEEFRKYLYEPYKDFGGNGVAERIMSEVSNLPLRSPAKYSEIVQARKRETNDDRAA